jgi:DNA repair exonuclease SbcCD nuclease subunit
MAFRFVHSADIHLDSPLRSLAFRNPSLGELISNATRQAFVRMVDLCIAEAVDALLLAGDLYDGDQTSMKTARFFADQMHRLDAAGIRTFILRGNHDALSKITRELVLPESVTVFGGWASAIALERQGMRPDVVIHGLSFSQATAPDSLLPKYKAPVAGAVNIGMMHTSLGGAPGHDPYAPCSLAELDDSGFQYWALGHIHKRSENVGRCTVVMAGNPQGRDINEGGAKSVSLVTVADDGAIAVETRNVSLAQFERLDVDISGLTDWRDLIGAIGVPLRDLRREVMTEHLIVRLRIVGKSDLAWQIRRDVDVLQAEVDAQADLVGRTWLEKIELEIAPAIAEDGEATDTIGELRRLIGTQVRESAGFQNLVREQADDLLKALPADIRGHFGGDEAGYFQLLDRLLVEGTDDVLARLQGQGHEADT